MIRKETGGEGDAVKVWARGALEGLDPGQSKQGCPGLYRRPNPPPTLSPYPHHLLHLHHAQPYLCYCCCWADGEEVEVVWWGGE